MCTLTDVVDGASTELSVELLGPESPEVVNGVGPEVEHIVPGEGVSFFNHHHLAAQQSQLDGRPKATRTAADDQTLNGRRLQLEWESIIQMSCSSTAPLFLITVSASFPDWHAAILQLHRTLRSQTISTAIWIIFVRVHF